MITLLLALQATVAPAAQALTTVDFDLHRTPPPGRDGNDIIVTGRRRTDPRLSSLPEPVETGALPRADTRLFGAVRGSIRVEQHAVGAAVSNRAMVSVRLPF
ncbi:MAG TPA: hypothetical protein VF503_22655 [Sphingobium sp.]|uniref:hypothetical protein n=1 Tax=Sphingobium sp. TaxID=1912891 RepID=UPI002ED03F40